MGITDETRVRLRSARSSINTVRRARDMAESDLQSTADELEGTLNSALEVIDTLVQQDSGTWPVAKRFIRRILSREFIIAVVSIIVIWQGGLDTQQAIGVAIAGGGLALGRGVAKARSGGSDR